MHNNIVEIEAKKYYTNLPYHNFNHTLKVADTAVKIIAQCRKDFIEIEEDVIYYAILFHDAGYAENEKKLGFDTKEDYAANIASKVLKQLGFKEEKINKVMRIIIATHRNVPWKSIEEGIIRAADLAGLASEYPEFLENSKNLKKEYELLNKKQVSSKEWKEMSKKLIKFYINEEIKLSRNYYDKEGRSIFHEKARRNLDRFLQEKEI